MVPTLALPIEQDKILHFTVSYAATYTLSNAFKALGLPSGASRVLAGSAVMFAGGIKEFTDNPPDQGDAIANMAGIGFAIGIDALFGGKE